jgi:hypothetical protein
MFQMEDAGIEPATSRMQSERSATELNPLGDYIWIVGI